MEIVLKGILSGILLAFLIGPVFFTILQTSLERGFASGAYVAVGVSLSDMMYIFIAYLGIARFAGEHARSYMAYAGGGVLLCFGVYYLAVKGRSVANFHPEQITYRSPLRLVAKGFVINGMSPMVLFFWIATVSLATAELGYTRRADLVTYFGSIVLTVFLTDLLKAKLADRLRSVVTPRFIQVLNIVLGVVLILFAGKLILFPERVAN